MKRAFLLLPLVLLAAGCGGSSSGGSSTAPATLNHVTVEVGPGANQGFYAARAQGYYTKAGLDVNLRAGKLPVDAVLRGRAELGATVQPAVAEAKKRSADLVVVGTAGLSVVARGDWLKDKANKDIADRFLAASEQGLAYCTTHKGATACQS
jgi:ABC-type nitrate/sulfonate/bicarbonate transport system substrate-binding protein